MKKKTKNEKIKDLIRVENFIDYDKGIEVEKETFKKVMFFYSIAIQELETKIKILKDEFKILYEYDLIDHINSRVKTPESIMYKMQKRNIETTYKNMIENINDIAGIRIVCPLQNDVFSVRDLITKFPGIKILKEKDYITHPKKSGYSSYHMIVEVPITLSKQNIYVKVEIQIRTIAMDFWATLEHKMKYKPQKEIDNKKAKEWVNCAKIVNKLDHKMMLLN